ncbi:2-polyprenyl-3-methyl-6-methoxy-1,4-benzoquinone monooxygenase [Microbulbifer sp. EKSA008]|uniref:2-polyprenyl-3-methyl-6-methoxy-1,4-benzoquinone monooxygenase n=1 Tax=unclassified Microbulbifer TaxID=2619833 RepID=UPI000D52BEB0|nr:2-polyprenyl-3-methyl-6-methoxy-1,4-benzoquinone monooxygenase [Microbulbifer sp. A4B17]AWF79761.1 demethoxyubiquinone hydroxylase family protein [Microbulbifer sp. A4B17]WNZ56835.1 2-polyprenyl-3-methyl-6-methoxy-1,4-benzoquinone monooxygenase [Microbulbifer sp. MKSA007]
MSKRSLSGLDRLLIQADRALRTLSPGEPCHGRASPAKGEAETDLTDSERKHAAGLMRVNHSGEVCAQALYQGQALTAKLPEVRGEMERAADEEIDHLAWCEQRLKELDSRPSLLNPLWYGMSFGLGAAAGKISDRISLGFVAATEDQVCKHLESHLEKLPADDKRSRAVVEQMLIDEDEHAHAALAAGGARFPAPVKGVMSLVSKVMTSASYKI